MIGNYNTDLTLWQNTVKARDYNVAVEGEFVHRIKLTGEVLERNVARFDSETAAIETLVEAGFVRLKRFPNRFACHVQSA